MSFTNAVSTTVSLSPSVDSIRVTVDPIANLTPHVTSDQKKTSLRDDLSISTVDSGGGSIGNQDETDAVEVLKDRFLHMRDVVLNLNIKTDQIPSRDLQPGDLEEIDDFRIIFNLNVAVYTDPNTGKEITVDLLDLPIEAQKVMDTFFNDMNKVIRFRRYQTTRYAKHNKGNLNGEKPLQKTTGDLQNRTTKDHKQAQKEVLPQLLLEAKTPEVRKTITNRVMFAELAHESIMKHFDETIKRKDRECKQLEAQQRADPQNFTDQRILTRLSNEIVTLKKHHQELKHLNIDALTRVLGRFPVGSYTKDDLKEAVDRFVAAEKKELEITRKSNAFVKFGWSENEETRDAAKRELEYIDDEVGMFYTTRRDYADQQMNRLIPQKQECLEDIFLREAISFVDALEGRGNYDGKGFAQSSIFADFTEDEKNRVFTLMDTNARKWNSREQFPNVDPKHFKIETQHNPGAKVEEKEAVDQKRRATLETKISEYRTLIFSDKNDGSNPNPGLIPPPPPLPIPNP